MKKSILRKHLFASMCFLFLMVAFTVVKATDQMLEEGLRPILQFRLRSMHQSQGDVIKVYPGLYDQDEANGYDPNTGGSGGNDFNIFVNKSITIQGVDGSGSPITDANSAVAIVKPKRNLPTFGTSAIFVQADNVTIKGLKVVSDNGPSNATKAIEVAGDNATIQYVYFDLANGDVGIYTGDFHYNPGTNVAHLQSYTYNNNVLRGDQNESGMYIANGAGWPNSSGARLIQNNVFDQLDDALDFAGTTENLGWLLYPVGTATISGNSFSGIARRHLEVWGEYNSLQGYAEPDWCGIMSGNTFDKGAFTWEGTNNCSLSGTPRRWESLLGAGGNFRRIAGIYSLTLTGAGSATTIIQAPAVLSQ